MWCRTISRDIPALAATASLTRISGAALDVKPEAPIARRSAIGRQRARSSAGEHSLHTGGVTGSIPVAPTINQRLRGIWKTDARIS